jgi:RNA polymerase sigma factor (sigma-70 family)
VSDTQLLERFVRQRDGAAFELLVWRHQRLVLGQCRRLLSCEQDAEDAFQATFLALACKAGSIGKREAVASWLYKVAYRVALRLRASERNRIRHEQRLAAVRGSISTCGQPCLDALQSDLRSAVHEEIERLPETYRAPIVLCYLEGKTNEEAAVQMSCPTGTVVTRLARARQRLRSRLARRGWDLPAGCLVAALTPPDLSAAAPPLLLDQTVKAALVFASDPTASGVVPAKVATLARGVLKTMVMTRLKLVVAVLMLIGFAGTGSGVFAYCNWTPDEPLPRSNIASAIAALPGEVLQTDQQPKKRDQGAKATKEQRQKKDDDKNTTITETVSKSFKVGKTPKVIVELYNGAIEVSATADASVDAKVTKQGQGKTEEEAKQALKLVDVKMTQEGDTIRIQESRPEERGKSHYSYSASAELKVPPGAILELKTLNGSVTLTASAGKVHAHTLNGKIQANKSKGPLELRTSNGEIVVKEAAGPLDLKTVNGSIEIQAEKAVLKAETVNGSVEFQGSLAKGEQSLKTTNGSLTLTLPAGSSFKVEADTVHGKITNEFSTEKAKGEPGTEKKGKGRGNQQLRSAIGQDPVVDLKLHTVNGSISIRRQEAKK